MFWTSGSRTSAGSAFRSSRICVGLGLFLAILLDQQIRNEGALRAVFLYPMALSFIVTGTARQWIMTPSMGLEKVFHDWGWTSFSFSWLGNPDKAIFCVVIAAVWQSTGFVMALFLAGLRGVDSEIFKAAQMDGAEPAHHLSQDRDSEHAAGVLLGAADSLPHHDQDLRPRRRVDGGRAEHVVVAAGYLHVHVFVQSRAARRRRGIVDDDARNRRGRARAAHVSGIEEHPQCSLR